MASPLKKVTLVTLLFLGLPFLVTAEGASFRLEPREERYRIGETFYLDVFIDSEKTPINAGQATIYFSSEKLKALEISKEDSVFTLWPQEPFHSNVKGEISFIGGLPSPGFTGRGGKVISILFLVKALGETEIYFGDEKILANDPEGKDIFSFSQTANYFIVPVDRVFSTRSEEDIRPPYPFRISFDNEGDSTNPSPFLYFETQDDASGISHYEVEIGENVFRAEVGQTQPWQVPPLMPGGHSFFVRAFDRAGNFTEKSIEIKIDSIASPQITSCPKTLYPEKDLFYLGGTALPDSKVIIFLGKEGKLIKKWEVTTDSQGNWLFHQKALVNSGLYMVTARTEDSRRAISNSSEPCFVGVILWGLVIGSWYLSYGNLILTLTLLLILFSIIIFYFIVRAKRTRMVIERETKDLKEKFYKEYRKLQADIERELKEMEKLRGEREINEEERRRKESLLKNLKDLKEVIERELKDIEEIR